MKESSLSFEFKARYFKLGEITEHTSHIWFVLHGYGQLAQFFIRKFNKLENSNCCVIAPEGLSRFYQSEISYNGTRSSDKVGATWMTKENRLMDIENYIHYLNKIYHTEIPKTSSAKVSILGFSQGAATASRWVMSNTIRFDRLILWAGAFPPDMDFAKGREILKSKEIIEAYGANDPFINPDRLKELQLLNDQLKIRPRIIRFDGKHEIDEPTLLTLV
jgi:predicted esterase